MYSTRLVNKNWVDGNRYITVGDPFKDPVGNPFRQGKKGEKLTPFRTKMFPVNEENGFFTKTVYKGGGYQEATRYIQAQPLDGRKRGFGTKDAHKRDEFSNGVRTEQYRESIRKEKFIIDKGATQIQEKLQKLLEARNNLAIEDKVKTIYDVPVPQFDIGRERVTEFDPKATKDTFYKFRQNQDKRYGLYKPVSVDVGDSAWTTHYKPPSHGGKSEVKNFYDKSHLSVSN